MVGYQPRQLPEEGPRLAPEHAAFVAARPPPGGAHHCSVTGGDEAFEFFVRVGDVEPLVGDHRVDDGPRAGIVGEEIGIGREHRVAADLGGFEHRQERHLVEARHGRRQLALRHRRIQSEVGQRAFAGDLAQPLGEEPDVTRLVVGVPLDQFAQSCVANRGQHRAQGRDPLGFTGRETAQDLHLPAGQRGAPSHQPAEDAHSHAGAGRGTDRDRGRNARRLWGGHGERRTSRPGRPGTIYWYAGPVKGRRLRGLRDLPATDLLVAERVVMTPREIRAYLDEHERLAPGTKIQYGHPSPRFWHAWDRPLDELVEPLRRERPLSLYLHVPFCPPTDPPACGFCLFAREDFRSHEVVAAYCRDLLAELEQMAAALGDRRTLYSVYFGGGTPNLMRPEEIVAAMDSVRRCFDLDERTEVTFEGYPTLFTPERLEACLAAGVTRISVGVQQLDPRLLRFSGRRHEPEDTRAVVEFCRRHGLRCSVDLITGWFEQTADDVVGDVEQLAAWGVTGIVNHPLTLAGDSPFGRRAAELPDQDVQCEAFLAARRRMLELGFRADSYTDYARREVSVVRYLHAYRNLLDHDRVGVGYGANSLLAGTMEEPGRTWVNVADLDLYGRRVRARRAAVASGFAFTAEDLQLLYVLKGLEGEPYLRADAYAERFGGDLARDFAPWWEVLTERGWLEWRDGGPRLIGRGVFYTAMVQRCLSEPRNRVLRAASQAG